MREILFREKRKDNGEWREGFYTCVTSPETIDEVVKEMTEDKEYA